MKIEYRTGDLLDCGCRVIAHGCNARGVMGSGVARAIRARHPAAYAAYRAAFEAAGLKPGDVVWADLPEVTVANMITQNGFGGDGRRYVDYDAVAACVRELDRRARAEGWHEIALPLVGAGLGGGEWPTIAAILERESAAFVPVVVTLDGRVPRVSA